MATLTSLDELLRAIHNAGIEAQKLTEQQHVRQLRRYFKEDGTPITMAIKLPNAQYDPNVAKQQLAGKTGGGELDHRAEQYVEFDAPLLSLVPPGTLRIKTMDVRFKVKLQGLLGDDGDTSTDPVTKVEHHTKGPLRVEMGGGMFTKKSQLADISITFEGTDPPESLMKINDHFLRSFP
ncbi:DUF2589 domain-containing protein [Prosthecobacter sp.]|uniref:DUF2589 domain-containing protein n=1 Tax=Prosthecobacter sp. TaxID=1965333 RepID=UPI002487986C|nr:DUF2589 domain-containing protein [Prosthecobacter sp.]MDI1312053.1 DUF2589 domain-containing protein [Prosthecobacter sp.]